MSLALLPFFQRHGHTECAIGVRTASMHLLRAQVSQSISQCWCHSGSTTLPLSNHPQFLPKSNCRDSPNGPRVKYTHVGEQLYHVWECRSNMYSMLLYNCSAIDGKGADYPIIDANGCSRDEFLMPQITYTQDRTKAMAVSVFGTWNSSSVFRPVALRRIYFFCCRPLLPSISRIGTQCPSFARSSCA